MVSNLARMQIYPLTVLRKISSNILPFLISFTVLALPALSMELGEYQKEIENTIQILESSKDKELEREITPIIEKILSWDRVTLEGVWIETDHQWLILQFESITQEQDSLKREEALKETINRLKNLKYALEWPETSIKDPKPLLSRILRRREFAQTQSNLLLMRISKRIAEWLERFFQRLRLNIDWSPLSLLILKWFFYSVLGILLAVIMILLIRKIIPRIPSRFPRATTDAVTVSAIRSESSQKLRAIAQECATRGNYRSAVRYLYLSLLVYLDEKGTIEYDRTETNSEYLKKISPDLSLHGLLKTLTLVFERCWYGLIAPSQEEYRQFLNHCQRICE